VWSVPPPIDGRRTPISYRPLRKRELSHHPLRPGRDETNVPSPLARFHSRVLLYFHPSRLPRFPPTQMRRQCRSSFLLLMNCSSLSLEDNDRIRLLNFFLPSLPVIIPSLPGFLYCVSSDPKRVAPIFPRLILFASILKPPRGPKLLVTPPDHLDTSNILLKGPSPCLSLGVSLADMEHPLRLTRAACISLVHHHDA